MRISGSQSDVESAPVQAYMFATLWPINTAEEDLSFEDEIPQPDDEFERIDSTLLDGSAFEESPTIEVIGQHACAIRYPQEEFRVGLWNEPETCILDDACVADYRQHYRRTVHAANHARCGEFNILLEANAESIWWNGSVGVFTAVVTEESLASVMTDGGIISLTVAEEESTLDYGGDEVSSSLQLPQFPTSADGDTSGYDSVAVIDDGFNVTHTAWLDWAGSSSRLFQDWNCHNNPCTAGATTREHGTRVASAIFADLLDGQDPAYPTHPFLNPAPDRANRTGIAQEAEFSLISVAHSGGAGSSTSIIRGFDRAINDNAIFVNLSMGNANNSACRIRNRSEQLAVNDAYEAGLAVFAAVGNDGHIPGDCHPQYSPGCGTICCEELCAATPYASAHGSFAVGGIAAASSDSASDYYTNGAYRYSSHGLDTGYDGNNYWEPNILDIAAPAGRQFQAIDVANSGSTAYDNLLVDGTSIATPFATGTASLLRDDMLTRGYSNFDTPGHIYAALLAMGDGFDPALAYDDTTGDDDELSSVTGAGRLRTRMVSNAGMDNPWGVAWDRITMTASSEHLIPAGGGNPLNADIDRYRHAFWTYEPAELDRVPYIRMYVKSITPSNPWGYTADPNPIPTEISPDRRDWRGRIDLDNADIDNHRLYSRFYVGALPSGPSSRDVYYFRYSEDLDRDDSDGPAAGID